MLHGMLRQCDSKQKNLYHSQDIGDSPIPSITVPPNSRVPVAVVPSDLLVLHPLAKFWTFPVAPCGPLISLLPSKLPSTGLITSNLSHGYRKFSIFQHPFQVPHLGPSSLPSLPPSSNSSLSNTSSCPTSPHASNRLYSGSTTCTCKML